MHDAKSDIINRLRKDIISLHNLKTVNTSIIDIKLGPIKNAFPGKNFPIGFVHEFTSAKPEDTTVTEGFIASLLSSLMQNDSVALWIGSCSTIFPPALHSFGIKPDNIIFIDLKKEKEILWTMEEALRCGGLAAVVGEVKELEFTASRRLQLAVEHSKVTGFVLRHNPRYLNTTACIARWKITSLPAELPANMPGVGFPRWNVELLKVKNGIPGNWQIEFSKGHFRTLNNIVPIQQQQQKKTG